MDTKDLHKLVKWYAKLNGEIKTAEAQLKEELADKVEKRKKILDKLGTAIHKGEDGIKSVNVPGVGTAYARSEDKYKVTDFNALKEGILTDDELALDSEQVAILMEKLDIFPKTVTKDVIISYREDTGAEEEDGKLVGGDLPPGVGLYVHHDVRINSTGK